jgi:hypothetical protein
LQVAVSVNPAHAEALNNLAILELRRYSNISESTRQLQALEQAKSFLGSATEHGAHLFEPAYNRYVSLSIYPSLFLSLSLSLSLFLFLCTRPSD